MRPKLLKHPLKVQADFNDKIIPENTVGTVVECYENPEGYAVDIALSNQALVGDLEYLNVLLSPDEFVLIDTATQPLNAIIQ
ncbi:hypothetical protein WA1_28590 [Scytonema hofmannii PCC 7110]|uniref:DUF4926 domain-containing protein n=1 Tax=Scytonema hofmannii PCC 7110 TaxID=128403 RepID=A0A139X5H0_9CYAN|nr:hypothetical protein [Scytonema hofmannii]KYC39925.1 hypothetical protein WA1_28590 [Scytonema hofmannii PCC 7110]